jgi:hypothetical protein
MELESKPDFNQAMQRIYAWYEQEMIDRLVRFTRRSRRRRSTAYTTQMVLCADSSKTRAVSLNIGEPLTYW